MSPDAAKPPPAREIFLDALERGAAVRASFLDAACSGRPEVRREVEELLRAHGQSESFLETPALAPRESQTTIEISTSMLAVMEKAGDRIGRYKLLQKIGEGGCGVVYMAEQEEPVRRRVALKIIKLGMDTKSVIARFEAERQALAMMEHPNIARVLDAGATEAGRPYFVMELVRGVRITEYCDQNHLPTEERLRLFTQVCQAIQHAHQKGVIHRDIKPSNILVTLHDSVPVPKVIDFGIAKATEQRLTDKTLFTEFQSFIGTPAYMSPEQAEMSGLDIDTRSDIYSLGVLLYEMLTGHTPFHPRELMELGLDECRRTIREKEPSRPSARVATLLDAELTATAERRRTDAPRLIHSLRGDLDWIVMKSLEKDRTRRYPTANDLAADVQRYLEGDTVLARPPSNVYRLQKLLRRHQGVVAAAASMVALLLAGSTVSTWLAIRATKAEHLAEASQKLESGLRRRAEEESAAARLNEYVADINLAEQSRLAGNYGRAVQLLRKHLRSSGETDLRGFEWRYLWQMTRGDEHVTLPVQDINPQCVALAPSGDVLAVGGERSVQIWSLTTRSLIATHPHGASSMAFLPDGRQLVVSDYRSARILSSENWLEIRTLSGAGGSVALARDGTRLAMQSRDGLRIWNTADWSEIAQVREAGSPMSLSPDGRRLVAETRSGAGLGVWFLETNRPPILLEDSTNLVLRVGPWSRNDRAVVFSPDGRNVVAARNTLSERGVFVLSVWDAESGEEVEVIPADPGHVEHTGGINSILFSPDGRLMATASMDHSIRLWDFERSQRLRSLQGNLSEVWSISFSRDGRTLASVSKDGAVKVWSTKAPVQDEEWSGARLPLGFSPDGQTLAAQTRTNSLLLFNVRSGEVERELLLDPGAGRSGPDRLMAFRAFLPVAVSADLGTVAIGRFDDSVLLWHPARQETNRLELPLAGVSTLALSPDGKTLIAAGRGAMRWCDLPHGTNVVTETEAGRFIYSPDGRRLAGVTRDSVIEIWDTASRTILTNLSCEVPVTSVGSGLPAAFSPDGRWLAVGCQDGAIRLWEIATGTLSGVLTGHKQSVYTVAFAPDGKTLATASDDSTLVFWNLATHQQLLTVRRLGGAFRGLMFSPDGRLLAGGSSSTVVGGGLRLFRAPLASEIEAAEAKSRSPQEFGR